MRILYITPTPPDCRNHGAAQRSALLGDALHQIGEVWTLRPAKRDERFNDHEGIFRCFPHKFSWRRIANALLHRLVRCNFVSEFLTVPYPIRPDKIFPGITFDCVVVRYLYPVAKYMPWRVAPFLYVDVDDWPLQVFDTSVAPGLSSWRRRLYRALLMWRVAALTRHARGAWVANPQQTDIVQTQGPTRVLPNLPLPPSPNYKQDSTRSPALMTVGLLNYPPNRDGIAWFLREVWPLLHTEHPRLEYWIIGDGLDAGTRQHWAALPNVKCLGFVKDLDEPYERALATIVPILSGGGTCIKTLEALAHGRVCLTTPFGARGCSSSWVDGTHGLHICANAKAFVQALDTYILDPDRRSQQERSAKALADESFSFSAFRDSVAALLTNTSLP